MLTALLDGAVMAERHGAGSPTVVALHGWGRSGADWNAVLTGHDALAPDLPGHGSTPTPPADWGSPQYAQQVIDILDRLDAPVTLVGHSFGGRVAVTVAARRPDLVSALVLTGVPLFRRSAAPATPPLAFRAGKWLHRRGVLSDALMDRLRERHGSPDYRAARGPMREVFVRLVNESYDAQVAAVAASRVPVTLVWGADDTEVPASVAQRIAEALPQASLRVVEGSGHLLDGPLTAALREAIGEHRGRDERPVRAHAGR